LLRFFKKWGRALSLFLASFVLVAYTGLTTWPTGSQSLAHGDIAALVGAGQLIWSSNPGWATTDGQNATFNEFETYVKNNGSCGGVSNQIIDSAQAQACRVLTAVHTPILTNNTFAGSFSAWSSSYANGATACTMAVPTAFNYNSGTGEDGAGYASATSGTNTPGTSANQCYTTHTLSQTFSISGSPTSQSYSFWYESPSVGGGGDSSNCSPAYGSATITFKINSTVVQNGSAQLGTAWHQLSGTTTALVNGSNTVTLTVVLNEGVNQSSHFNSTTQIYTCLAGSAVNATFDVDNFALAATY
jgi:hypothetical protein